MVLDNLQSSIEWYHKAIQVHDRVGMCLELARDFFSKVCAGFVHLNVQEQNEMLQKVGFRNIQRMTIGKGMFEFITATK